MSCAFVISLIININYKYDIIFNMLEETMIMMITGAKTVLEIKEWRPFIPKNKKKKTKT